MGQAMTDARYSITYSSCPSTHAMGNSGGAMGQAMTDARYSITYSSCPSTHAMGNSGGAMGNAVANACCSISKSMDGTGSIITKGMKWSTDFRPKIETPYNPEDS